MGTRKPRQSLVLPGSGGLAARVAELARRLPGAERVEEQLRELEQRFLHELHHRLDALERGRLLEPQEKPSPDLRQRFAALAERGISQRDQEAQQALFHQLLDQLTPDEARLLTLMSEGDEFPVLHVGLGPPVGPIGRRLASNLSNLGKTAGLRRVGDAPLYLARLRRLGLLEFGPESKALNMKYQMIEGGAQVRELHKLENGTTQRLRLQRATVKLSALGKEFWAACRPQGDDDA